MTAHVLADALRRALAELNAAFAERNDERIGTALLRVRHYSRRLREVAA